ncbi:MAG: hypothetical protein ACI93S_000950 [Ancylomarina sp.]|jgi:hypothetical protein
MIKHIAMFKFKAFESKEEKENYNKRLKKAFDGLDKKVPEIKYLQIGFDELGSEASFDFVVNVDIENIESLSAYANHPKHVKAVSVIKEMLSERKVIDYSF